MGNWSQAVCADVADAAEACSTAIAATPRDTLRAWFLEDAFRTLRKARVDLVAEDLESAVEALFTALGLLSDAIDAADIDLPVDLASVALDYATHAVAVAASLES